jgi:hypothetical protein
MNSTATPIAGCLGSLIGTGVLFIGLNMALYSCQEEKAREYNQPYQEKKDRLAKLSKQISICKKELSGFKEQSVNNMLPPNIYDNYKDTLDLCKKNIREHNLLVPEVNKLGRKVNSRIYILPMPRRSGASVH